jgi:hypothetical protein
MRPGRRVQMQRALLVLTALMASPLLSGCVAPTAGEAPSLGLIVRDHGEFERYDERTFTTLKALVDAYWPYTNAPAELLHLDSGTWYIDAGRPWDNDPHLPVRLEDAWTNPGPLMAVPVRDPLNLTAIPHELAMNRLAYVAPGGPGQGVGDLYELFALAVYRKYLAIDNFSPHWQQSKPYWDAIQQAMEARGIPVAFAHSEDPHIDPEHTFDGAARRMVQAGVQTVVSLSQSTVGSDFDACVKRPELEEALHRAGFQGRIVHADATLASRTGWAEASARHVAAALATLPASWRVAVMDVHHGFPPSGISRCFDRQDPYHDRALEASGLFEFALARQTPRDLTIQMVYNEFAEARGDEYLSPDEALEHLLPEHDAVLLVSPYFLADGMDLLVTLREALGWRPIEAPYADAGYESRRTVQGTLIWVLSSDHGQAERTRVLMAAVEDALEAAR